MIVLYMYQYQKMQEKKDRYNYNYNASILKSFIRAKIMKEIDQISSMFCLYAEEQILSAINFAFDYKFSGEVHKGNSYTLVYDREAIDIDQSLNIIFMIYSDPKMIQVLASMIHNNQASNIKKNYHVYFIPGQDFICSEMMEKIGISHKVKTNNFNFDFIPLNENLFSLELPRNVQPITQDKLLVESLLRICNIIGVFRAGFGLGKRSESIIKMFQQEQEAIPQISQNQASDTYLIMLDRQLDLVTPMLTPFSYEGLLDLFFGIKFNQIQFPGHIIGSNKPLETIPLYTSKDIHYKVISKMQIRQVHDYLLQKSEQLSLIIKQEQGKAKGIEDLNQIQDKYIGQLVILQNHQSIVIFLQNQINSCPFINAATLESVALQNCQRAENLEYLSLFYSVEDVLKLEILSSQVSEVGSYYSRYEKKIMETILQSYHPKHLITVHNLVEGNILKSSRSPLKWKQICQVYDLIPDDPHPYTYIHIIYSALLVRFLELFLTNNLNTEKINLIGEPLKASGQSFGKFHKLKKGDTVYIYIVGGITYSQAQCFKILGQKMGIQFMLCSNQVISGRTLIKRYF